MIYRHFKNCIIFRLTVVDTSVLGSSPVDFLRVEELETLVSVAVLGPGIIGTVESTAHSKRGNHDEKSQRRHGQFSRRISNQRVEMILG